MSDIWIWIGVALAVSTAATWLLTPLAMRVALRFGAVDRPHLRKVHRSPIPRLGGLAVAASFYATFFSAWALGRSSLEEKHQEAIDRMAPLMLAALPILALGIVDDLKGLRASLKFAVQLAVAVAVIAFADFRFEGLNIPFLGIVDLKILSVIVLAFWLVGVTNAFNLMDGLDGLSAGVGGLAALAVAVMAFLNDNPATALAGAALAGSCFGFLRHNFHPAKIFMGDSGSLFLGFLLAIISVEGANKRTLALALTLPIIVLGIPVVDALVSIFRRTLLGRSPMSPDRGHLHHLLLRVGFDQRKVALMFYAVTFCFGAAAAVLTFAKDWVIAVSFVVFLVLAALCYRMFGYRVGPFLKRRHNWRDEARRTVALLEAGGGAEKGWPVFCELLKIMEIEEASLILEDRGEKRVCRKMDGGGGSSDSELSIAVFQDNDPVGEFRIAGARNVSAAALMGAAQVIDPILERFGPMLMGLAPGPVTTPTTRVRRAPTTVMKIIRPPTDLRQ